MKKIIIISLILFLFVITIYTTNSQVQNKFNNSLTQEILQFGGNQNITRYLRLRNDSEILNATITLIQNTSNYRYINHINYSNSTDYIDVTSNRTYAVENNRMTIFYKHNDTIIQSKTFNAGLNLRGLSVVEYANSTLDIYATDSEWHILGFNSSLDVISNRTVTGVGGVSSGLATLNGVVFYLTNRGGTIHRANFTGVSEVAGTPYIDGGNNLNGIDTLDGNEFWAKAWSASDATVKSIFLINSSNITLLEIDSSYPLPSGYNGRSHVGISIDSKNSRVFWVGSETNYSQLFNVSITFALNPYLVVNNSYVWNYTGYYNFTNTTTNFNESLRTYLNRCIPDANKYCNIPIIFHSDITSQLNYSLINVNFTYPPIITYAGVGNITSVLTSNDESYFNITIEQENNDTIVYRNFSLSLNTTYFNYSFNPVNVTVTNTTTNYTTLNLNVTGGIITGTYRGNMSFLRSYDSKNYTFPIIITLTNNTAVTSFGNNSAWTEVGTSIQTFSRTLSLNNTGDYNLTNIDFRIDKGAGLGNLDAFMTHNISSNLTLINGSYLDAKITITKPSTALYSEEYLKMTGYGTENNDTVTTTNSVLLTFTISNPSTEGGGSGGGPSPECSITQNCIDKFGQNYYCRNEKCVLNVTAIVEREPICGDGDCLLGKEDFITCSADCFYDPEIVSSCFDGITENDLKCFIKQKYFTLFVIMVFILSLLYLAVVASKKRRKQYDKS